jgi:hypothetical protein
MSNIALHLKAKRQREKKKPEQTRTLMLAIQKIIGHGEMC